MTTAVCCKSYNQKIYLFVNPFNYFLCVVHTVTIQKADIQIHTGFIWPFTCLVLKWLLSHVTCPSCCVFPPPFSSCAREAHVRRMKKKVCLGVTPKSWLTPKSWMFIKNFLLIKIHNTKHLKSKLLYGFRMPFKFEQQKSLVSKTLPGGSHRCLDIRDIWESIEWRWFRCCRQTFLKKKLVWIWVRCPSV